MQIQILLCTLYLFAAGCAQDPYPVKLSEAGVQIGFSTNRVMIGDVFRAEVAVEHPAGTVATLPSVDNGDTVSVLSRQVETREVNESTLTTRFSYDLQSFEVGFHSLTTNALTVKEGGDVKTLLLPDLPFEVVSALERENEMLAELKGPVLWPEFTESRLMLALIAVMLIALVAGVIALMIRRSKKPKIAPPVPVIPAHELALKALRDLKAEPWLAQGDFERYYVTLSDIVRHYLENRFDLHAPERTTEEFIREAAEHSALNLDQKQRVQEFLVQSDLVKFARFTPSSSEADSAYGSAVQLVEETRERIGGTHSHASADAQACVPPRRPSDENRGDS